jgi:hypothetical protein
VLQCSRIHHRLHTKHFQNSLHSSTVSHCLIWGELAAIIRTLLEASTTMGNVTQGWLCRCSRGGGLWICSDTSSETSQIFFLQRQKNKLLLSQVQKGGYTSQLKFVSAWLHSMFHLALIFLRKLFNPSLYSDAPPWTLQLYQESDYMTGDLFVQWLEHFMSSVKPNVEEKILLRADVHLRHKNMHALGYAKQHGVATCIPQHCTLRLQPLGV